jgi:MSHA biogenesis protein MshM
LSPSELLAYLAVKLGADPALVEGRGTGLDSILREIETRLAAYAKDGRHPIILIDEAHAIEDTKVFVALQHLLNYRQPPETDFSLILVGESPLLPRVGRIPGLEERVTVKSLLRPLTHEETAQYTAHRLNAAGLTQEVFDGPALDELFQLSGGIPRRVNRICDLALLVGYADRLTTLSASHVATVAEELTSVVSD